MRTLFIIILLSLKTVFCYGQTSDTVIYDIEKDYQSGDFGSAIYKIKRQIKSDTVTKNLVYCYDKLGWMYYNSGLMDSALYFSNIAVKLNEDYGLTRFTRAVILTFKQKHNDALNDINIAIQYSPETAIYYDLRALLYEQLKKKKLATLDLKKTKELALKYNNPGLYETADRRLKELSGN